MALAQPPPAVVRREARWNGGAAYSCSTGGADGSTGDGPWASEASANIAEVSDGLGLEGEPGRRQHKVARRTAQRIDFCGVGSL